MTTLLPAAPVGLSKRQKELLERRLEAERRDTEFAMLQLTSDVSVVQKSRHDSPTDDEHDPEGPTLAFEQSQAAALLRQATSRLDDIDHALSRITVGTYGTCVGCGKPISYARLGARPYASHCIVCAQRLSA